MNATLLLNFESNKLELAEKLATQDLKKDLGSNYMLEFEKAPNGDVRYTEFAQELFNIYYSDNLDLINKTLLS